MSHPALSTRVLEDPRRRCPRISVEALCTEYAGPHERHSSVVDLSAAGLRIERPFAGGKTLPVLQLEFELPGVDEVIWARGEVCYDRVVPGAVTASGARTLVRRLGVQLVAAARDLRLLADYVRWQRHRRPDWLPAGAEAVAAFSL